MKASLCLVALANALLAAASPTGAVSSAAVSSDTTPFTQDVFAHADVGVDEYCGGFNAPGCSDFCYRLGYRCYQCTSSYCWCTNDGC
ncbi:hypothetical protein QBC33DRAFT_540737 [Phialemonium atrogriseum]|uniref:Invertebrate defensins family profile domain-containing protein n=1 Tax=Phialemonium atrogriseum TaxID=1093897 RepID=A0AAJ0FLQ7_9PEZI|nr:uncharacterized protein QBC33DRAFT_540737 [Phialemonium atrogriseum]KAK1766949.1 hypothetical protein QBC33DRAFT_540737 [Phialemonium atrogriseum]